MSNPPAALDRAWLSRLRDHYADQLFNGALPFWLDHGRDQRHGGLVWHLRRDGSVYEHDKLAMWSNGRMIWLLSHLHNHVPNPPATWLDMARQGLEFALKHGFAPDGRMYYSLRADGAPLESPQDVFTELFHVEGFNEYALATRDDALARRAGDLFNGVWRRFEKPDGAFQPRLADGPAVRLFGHPLIGLNVVNDLRANGSSPHLNAIADQCLSWIFDLHMRRADQTLLEHVAWDGSDLPGYLGRMVRPGHMIEAGIFVIHEARHRGDSQWLQGGIDLVHWGYQQGWDEQYGGLFTDIDRSGPRRPIPTHQIYRAQGKEWWSHAEALYALLLVYTLTGEAADRQAYERLHDYVFSRFVDRQYGDWYLALHRDGTILSDVKGAARKSLFHVGRNLFWAWQLLNSLCDANHGEAIRDRKFR